MLMEDSLDGGPPSVGSGEIPTVVPTVATTSSTTTTPVTTKKVLQCFNCCDYICEFSVIISLGIVYAYASYSNGVLILK